MHTRTGSLDAATAGSMVTVMLTHYSHNTDVSLSSQVSIHPWPVVSYLFSSSVPYCEYPFKEAIWAVHRLGGTSTEVPSCHRVLLASFSNITKFPMLFW
jgi:hypothetical protein